jgi:hypothetical protein
MVRIFEVAATLCLTGMGRSFIIANDSKFGRIPIHGELDPCPRE